MPVLFIIGHTFPEPATTAAGRRMKQLISLFAELGYNIHFGSTAAPTKYTIDLSQIKVRVHELKLNDVSFDLLLKELKPDVVLFDRFITEEQFGWRVSDGCPEALKILDTEDLHFLRKARETAYKNDMEVTQADIFTAVAKRELASIMRCDLSLMISEVELELLTATFGIPRGLLWYVPLLVEVNNIDRDQIPTFSDRKDFIAVGNLKHAPNVASVKLLKILWPQIREKLPDAQLHIYGAYAPQELREMHSPKEGFNLMGWVDSISEVMGKAKVLLAPIPFGAGLKGKLIDAMVNGLPSVTTPMGAEGIYSSTLGLSWVCDDWKAFVVKAVRLYTHQDAWKMAQDHGFKTVAHRFDRDDFLPGFQTKMEELNSQLAQHRKEHFMGQVLQFHTLQSSKYMSKWIEEKGKKH